MFLPQDSESAHIFPPKHTLSQYFKKFHSQSCQLEEIKTSLGLFFFFFFTKMVLKVNSHHYESRIINGLEIHI